MNASELAANWPIAFGLSIARFIRRTHVDDLHRAALRAIIARDDHAFAVGSAALRELAAMAKGDL